MASPAPRPPARPVRRTQEERSAETRERLLDATLASLIEVGYAHTTTTGVCERAGVSRGAQVHHFPKKAELVIQAVEHLATRMGVELRERAGVAREGAPIDAVVDGIVEIFAEPVFYAALELWIAARTDAELLESLLVLERRMGRRLSDAWRELAGPAALAPDFDAVIALTMHLARGMALQKILRSDDAERQRLLGVWKRMVSTLLVDSANEPLDTRGS
ncbi:MAG: TetR/AcrR family transcriptional regulator [Myxococcota bacterium]|nr:TetR/AcrR family transcriptional regulator [Myxococcota bacterium]